MMSSGHLWPKLVSQGLRWMQRSSAYSEMSSPIKLLDKVESLRQRGRETAAFRTSNLASRLPWTPGQLTITPSMAADLLSFNQDNLILPLQSWPTSPGLTPLDKSQGT